MRTVIDANVLVSFLLTRGETTLKILQAWQGGKFRLLVSGEILLEIREVLLRFVNKKMVREDAAGALLRRLKIDSDRVLVLSDVNVSVDKKDNRYLACAKDGGADYLVTGDKKHLLPLKKFGRTKILPPAESLRVLEN